MEQKQVQATTTATEEVVDLGRFTAIAAAYSLDRQGERIRSGAFAASIRRWQASGKELPLHWNHQGGAESVIGSVDPSSLRERKDGLYVEGELDLADSAMAREAWRSTKANRIGLSFGYTVTKDRIASDGARELLEIDLYEISLTPAPANADTRVLSTKSADNLPTVEELRRQLARLMGDDKTTDEWRRGFERVTKGIDTRPLRVAEFPAE